MYDLALEYYNKALRIRKKNLGEKHPFVSGLYTRLGGVFEKQKKFGRAIKYYQKALVSNMDNFNDTIINEISETKISSYRNFDEIKIDFKTKDDIVYITIIK